MDPGVLVAEAVQLSNVVSNGDQPTLADAAASVAKKSARLTNRVGVGLLSAIMVDLSWETGALDSGSPASCACICGEMTRMPRSGRVDTRNNARLTRVLLTRVPRLYVSLCCNARARWQPERHRSRARAGACCRKRRWEVKPQEHGVVRARSTLPSSVACELLLTRAFASHP